MNDDSLDGQEQHAVQGPGPGGPESMLRAEIIFWREMLQDDSDSLPPESVERIRQALALAESKLRLWHRDRSTYGRSTGCPGGTSDPMAWPVH